MSTRWQIAQNPKTPLEVLSSLAHDPDEFVRKNVAENKSTTSELLLLLASDRSTMVCQAVARHPKTPPEALTILAKNEVLSVQQSVAWHHSTPPEVLRSLSQTKDFQLRITVARNLNTPPDVLASLAEDQTMMMISIDGNAPRNTPICEGVAVNRSAPPSVLERLAVSHFVEVRGKVAANLSTPPETLALLSLDNEHTVRERVANNLATPIETILTLSADTSPRVRQKVAGNAKLPVEVLERLYNDKDPDVKVTAAGKRTLSAEDFLELSKETYYSIRQFVVQHPKATPEALALIASKSHDEAVLGSIASHANISLELLTLLSKHPLVRVRYRVARNPCATEEILERLVRDNEAFEDWAGGNEMSDYYVSDSVFENEKLTKNLLERWSVDQDETIKNRALRELKRRFPT